MAVVVADSVEVAWGVVAAVAVAVEGVRMEYVECWWRLGQAPATSATVVAEPQWKKMLVFALWEEVLQFVMFAFYKSDSD